MSRTISTTLWRTNISGVRLEDLSEYLVAGKIDMNLDRDTGKLSATFRLIEPGRVRPYVDFLQPVLTIEYDDGTPTVTRSLGLYATRTPAATRTLELNEADFECEDLSRLLAHSAYSAVDNVPASTNVLTEVAATCDEAGISLRDFPTTSKTLASARTYAIGTTRLEKINDLLSGIAFYNIYPRLDGKLTSRAVVDLDQMQPVATLTAADIVRPVSVQTNDQTLTNVVIVIKDNAAEAALTSVARNDDAASPTSTASVGFEYVRVEKRSELASQTEADTLARRLLSESRTYYQTATLAIWPDAELGLHEVVSLQLSGELEDLSGIWWVRRWSLGLTPADCVYEMELNRVTSYSLGVTL